jgi:hypothetical protein
MIFLAALCKILTPAVNYAGNFASFLCNSLRSNSKNAQTLSAQISLG